MNDSLAILETSLYVDQLDNARIFYGHILGLEEYDSDPSRHLFFRCGAGMLLLFLPEASSSGHSTVNDSLIPLHGATGSGHIAFRVEHDTLETWKRKLLEHEIAIESEVDWPNGARSIYFRDPAGNSLEFATPDLWQ